MQTVMTTNNAYDSILLVDDNGAVVGAWTATLADVANYVLDTDASNWEPNYPDNTAISDYGDEIGRNGSLLGERATFWGIASN